MVILFLIALVLAWPTAGISIIAYVAFAVLRNYLAARVRSHDANIHAARKSLAAGEKRVPSWAGDEGENEIFVKVIQQKAMQDGVPQAYLQNILRDGDTFQNLVYFAGAMEHHGSSFTEQQAAVSDELVELWKVDPDDTLARGLQDGLTATEADEAVTGLEKLRKLALQGDSVAQLELAIIYAEGNSVIKDDAESLRLFRLAADKGNATAQGYLGMFYSEGDRVTKDDVEGVRWFRLAANQGDSAAQLALSGMYFAGRGVPRDPVTALMWMNIADANGNETAADHRDILEQPMTAEEILEATRRAKLCMASGYTVYTLGDTLEQGDSEAQRLINSVKQKTNMIADRYPPRHEGLPDTNEIIVDDAMRALAEMKELFKEADEAKTLCNQISEFEPVSTKPMIELFISLVEDNFQAVMINSLQIQTKIIDAINRMVLLNSNVPDGEGKEAIKELVATLTVSANKMGKLHAEMSDGMENVVVPAMRQAKIGDKNNGT